MTTARERYEQKTKVVTFRVSNEIYDQIEEVKAGTGLSNSDLVKLGAGIAQEEIKAKLAELSGLEDRLAELETAIEQKQQELHRFLNEERRRSLEELDIEMRAFKLFDQGWGLEEASFELGLPHETAYRYFQEWGEAREDKQAVERELLRECLRKHIDVLKNRRSWCALFPSSSKEALERIQGEIDYCEGLLSAPSKINQDWKAFLLAEYSAKIQPARARKTLNDTD